MGDGKSGMLFFFSKNRNYVIKTLKKSELKPMIELLPDYYAHMREYPDSLLCRFLALFTLSIFRQVATPAPGEAPTFGATPNQSYFLLVMSSAFLSPYTPDVVYDLKGSTKNRIVADDEILVKGFKALKKAKAKAEAAERLQVRVRASSFVLCRTLFRSFPWTWLVVLNPTGGDGEWRWEGGRPAWAVERRNDSRESPAHVYRCTGRRRHR